MMVAALLPAGSALAAVNPPPVVKPYERGPHDVAVLTCLNEVTTALRPAFGRVDAKRWRVPADFAWAQAASYYAAALPARDGWTVERLPEQQAGCRLRAWSNGPERLAVALTDATYGNEPFRVLLVITPDH